MVDQANILSMLVATGVALSEVDDFPTLIDLISETALEIAECEGCSIYEAEGAELHFLKTRNRVLEAKGIMPPFRRFSLPLDDKTIAGYAATVKKVVNLEDVYDLPAGTPFTFSPSFDNMTGYRSMSMLAIPMCDTQGELLGVLQLINRVLEDGKVVPFPEELQPYLKALSSQFGVVLRNAKFADELRRSRIETVKQFVKASEFHDSDTGGHIERMSRYSALIYRALGFDDKDCHMIELASMLHDVGKISIPDAILKKPGKLTPEEFEVMKRHTENGYGMLIGAESPFLTMGAVIARGHHEKWNGTGYPRGQKGEEIPLVARVVALADVFDALCSRRCYKESWPIESVLDEIKAGSGSHFDPTLVDLFFKNLDKVFEIRDSFPLDVGPAPALQQKAS